MENLLNTKIMKSRSSFFQINTELFGEILKTSSNGDVELGTNIASSFAIEDNSESNKITNVKFVITIEIGSANEEQLDEDKLFMRHVYETFIRIENIPEKFEEKEMIAFINNKYFAERYTDMIDKTSAILSLLGFPNIPFPNIDDLN